jgi:glycosyltransferase involved in cell wall biosynthesis
MIVKDEASVITRCLDSVSPLISHWIIVDTGSTDGTQDIIRAHMKKLGIPGKLYERPWQDFAHNRSEALTLARTKGTYSLIIDADDVLEIPPDFQMPPLTADSYSMEIRDFPLLYPRIQLVHNRLKWVYRGVLHEFLACEAPHIDATLPIGMRRNHDGARRKDPSRFLQDVEVFEKALLTETDTFLRTRYAFYLAQSYRDAKVFDKSITHYLERAKMGGWVEEIFVSLYQVAKLKEFLKYPDEDVLASYEAATAALPSRIEALHGASRYCRVKGLYQRGYDIAKRGLGKAFPQGGLFAEPWIYETGLIDEYAVNAYWIGKHDECVDACLAVLAVGKLQGPELQRVVQNARASWRILLEAKYSPAPSPATLPTAPLHIQQPLKQLKSARSSQPTGKIAVITPYYKEDIAVLRQCHESVVSTLGDVTHFFIADGFPNTEIDSWNVRHVILPNAHDDNGNTPRGIGTMLADVEGFDFIAYLDADNWFHPGHLDSLLKLHRDTDADICFSKRTIHQLDGTEIKTARDPDEENLQHIDTSCYLIHRRCFNALSVWLKMPRQLSPICDRIFLALLREKRFTMAFSKLRTVAFRSQYKFHYSPTSSVPKDRLKDNVGKAEANWLSTPDGIQETVSALGFYPDMRYLR